MPKIKIKNIFALLFVTFLVLAIFETVQANPNTSAASNESATLEVPVTGSLSEEEKPAALSNSSYETLIEIAILALTGLLFYELNTRRELR